MKKIVILAAAAVMLTTACEQKKSQFAKKTEQYAVVDIQAPDLSGISDNGKEVLNLYRFAADEVDAIYWEQYFGDKQQFINSIADADAKAYALINYGPWDRISGEPFVDGYSKRQPGANFYPADMTADEFRQFGNPDKESPYTLIRRKADGQLEAVWYHDAYKTHIDKIANYLTAAADITIKPSVKKYLQAKADALRTDNYYESSIAWLDMTDSKMDIVIGPNESTDDQLLGKKRSYEAYVMLKNEAQTEKMQQFAARLGEFQADLPCADEYKQFQPGTGSNIFSYDAIYYAGKANAGVKVIALNLPFDTDVQRDKGTRTILFENIIRNKFNYIVAPTGNLLLDADYKEHISQEAFFWNTAFREIAHGLGVKKTVTDGTDVQSALAANAPVLEEVKANVVGVYLVGTLQKHFDLPNIFTKEDALATFFASTIRSERYGEGSTLGRANIMIYNYLKDNAAFHRSVSGTYSIDFAKMESALAGLAAQILEIQATGNLQKANEFVAKYSKPDDNLTADIKNLRLENIPVDIQLNFKK